MVILHGFLGMSDNWKTLGSRYAQSGFQVHMPDLRNHGRSFHSEEWSYEAMAEDILNYCNHHRLDNIILMGHSMGGKVAMTFATTYPDSVEKLIIADIGPRFYRPHHKEILEGLAAVDFSKVKSRQEAEDVIAEHVPEEDTRQFLMKSLYRKDQNTFGYRFNLEVFQKNQDLIGQALGASQLFQKPTLFIRGERSEYIREADHEQIRLHFPAATFAVVPRAGHWLHAENPDDYFRLTIEFLTQ